MYTITVYIYKQCGVKKLKESSREHIVWCEHYIYIYIYIYVCMYIYVYINCKCIKKIILIISA